MKKLTQQIFDGFVREMERKLKKNDRVKHPDLTDAKEMYAAMHREVDMLIISRLIISEDPHDLQSVIGRCANIANYAMFFAYHKEKEISANQEESR